MFPSGQFPSETYSASRSPCLAGSGRCSSRRNAAPQTRRSTPRTTRPPQLPTSAFPADANYSNNPSLRLRPFEFQTKTPAVVARSDRAIAEVVAFIRIEHALPPEGGVAHAFVENSGELLHLVRGHGAIEAELAALGEIPALQRQAVGHQLGHRFPAIQGGVFQVLPVSQNLGAGFELDGVGVLRAKPRHLLF